MASFFLLYTEAEIETSKGRKNFPSHCSKKPRFDGRIIPFSKQPPRIPDLNVERSQARFNLKVFDLDLRHVHHPQGRLFRDMEYYKDEREAGLCVFRVENTLFKV